MNYLQSSRVTRTSGRHKVIIIAIVILLLYIFRNPVSSFISPAIVGLAKSFWFTRDLIVENPLLSNEREVSNILRERLRIYEAEQNIKIINGVHVLSSLAVRPYSTILIARGSGEGVSLGDIVVSTDGVLLGEIGEVYTDSSKVYLYSLSGRSTEVVLSDETRIIINGTGNQNFEASLPSGLKVEIGQYIFLPGPDHLVLARIEKIDSSPGVAFQKIYARTPLNIHPIRTVYVKSKIQ